jgi:hypothetical protein
MRGGKRPGAGRPKGSRELETVVREALHVGIDADMTPSLSYLRKVVKGHIKNPNQQKIEAAKALLAYEAPRWGERKPNEPEKSEEEINASIRARMADAAMVTFLVESAVANPEGQQNLSAALSKLGFKLTKAEGADVVRLAEIVKR